MNASTVPTNNEDRDALINLLDVNYDNPGDQPESWDFWRSRNADAILAAGFRRLPVSGDNAETVRAEAESWLKRLDGDSHWARSPEQRERMDHERRILRALLSASQPREAAPSDTDEQADHA